MKVRFCLLVAMALIWNRNAARSGGSDPTLSDHEPTDLTADERKEAVSMTPAEEQFHMSYLPERSPPEGWKGPVFRLRTDYPQTPSSEFAKGSAELLLEAPWLKVDIWSGTAQQLEAKRQLYAALIKDYCWAGNVDNGFDVHMNKVDYFSTSNLFTHTIVDPQLVPRSLDASRTKGKRALERPYLRTPNRQV